MSKSEIVNALGSTLPPPVIVPLLDDYESMIRHLFFRNYEIVLVAAGRLVESLFRGLSYLYSGDIPTSPNFNKIMKDLTKIPEDQLPSSIRILIPRAGKCLYDLRSKRGAVHTNKNISPNYMDSVFAVAIAQWILAELIRLSSQKNPEEIVNLINSVVNKKLPIVEEIEGEPLILLSDLSAYDSILITLYHFYPQPVETAKLVEILHSFSRANITTSIRNAEKSKLVFRKGKNNYLTAKGVKHVEMNYSTSFFG